MERKPGTSAKMTARTAVFARSDRSRQTKPSLSLRRPAVAEAGIVLDLSELGVNITESLADPLHQAAHVGTIAVLAVTGDEILAMHEIVDLPVSNIRARFPG